MGNPDANSAIATIKDTSKVAIKPANAPYFTPFNVTKKSFLFLFIL
jgi:hypothetical protein